MSIHAKGSVFEVTLSLDSFDIGSIEILKGLLVGIGVDTNDIVECEQWPGTCLSMYFNSQAKAKLLKKKVQGFHLQHVQAKVKQLLKKDWQTKWKEGFKPFALTKSFGVVPTLFKKKYRPRKYIPIYIETKMLMKCHFFMCARESQKLTKKMKESQEIRHVEHSNEDDLSCQKFIQ